MAYSVNDERMRTAIPRNTGGILPAGALTCILIETVFGIVTQTANQRIDISAQRNQGRRVVARRPLGCNGSGFRVVATTVMVLRPA